LAESPRAAGIAKILFFVFLIVSAYLMSLFRWA
jgi:uncharacterized membrane protein YtjA (UPF0391 family)